MTMTTLTKESGQPRNQIMKGPYSISRNDDDPVAGLHQTTDLEKEQIREFLSTVDDPYCYSVAEYDGDDDVVERLNGEEWLKEYQYEH